jgi:hypothetical protein
MENLDLNIENYDLDDILNLFKINHNFTESDLKKSKKIVLQTHPDKSGLKPEIFIFYSKAYKKLFAVWNFKNKRFSENTNYNINYDDTENHKSTYEMDNDKKQILNKFINSDKMENPKEFNKWFNSQFEKTKLPLEEEMNGYGDWLKSDEDVDNNSNVNPAFISEEFDKKKQHLRSVVVYNGVNELYTDNIGGSNLTSDAPEYYTSNIFSNLCYEDLKKAHTETVVPVTMEDYNNIPKFKSVEEYKYYRTSQNIVPLSELQAQEYLNKKNNIEKTETNYRAYKLAKQLEETKCKQELFWSGLMKLTNT